MSAIFVRRKDNYITFFDYSSPSGVFNVPSLLISLYKEGQTHNHNYHSKKIYIMMKLMSMVFCNLLER